MIRQFASPLRHSILEMSLLDLDTRIGEQARFSSTFCRDLSDSNRFPPTLVWMNPSADVTGEEPRVLASSTTRAFCLKSVGIGRWRTLGASGPGRASCVDAPFVVFVIAASVIPREHVCFTRFRQSSCELGRQCSSAPDGGGMRWHAVLS